MNKLRFPLPHGWWFAGAAALALALPLRALAAPTAQDVAVLATPSLWSVVLAMAAAAFAIERIMELIWNFVEWLVLSARRSRPADLKTATYLQFKSGVSVLLGGILGVLMASVLNLHLFAAVQLRAPGFLVDVPANWDVVITGLVIGVLAKPVHDLIELLAETKNFMSSAAIRQREAAGAGLADGVLKLAQSESETMIEVPGMGRTPLAGNGDYGAHGETTSPTEAQSPTDKYIDLLRNRTMM